MSGKSPALRIGDTLGAWKLQMQLDAGGNGDVWRVSRPGYSDAAMKILRRVDTVSYHRFRAEVEVLANNSDIKGIIPVIDHYLPEQTDRSPPWYVMPLATPQEHFLRGKSAMEIVQEFIKLANTLSVLHSRNISHRDIKPQNVLALDGRLCLSDFGLVKYPKRQPLTPARRDVGPKFTMAPEMRRFAAEANGLPADVFSFAKTLWIALTRKDLGFDGQYTAASNLGLKNFLKGIYTTTLDELLTECTDNDPNRRPIIDRVAERLTEWLRLNDDFHRRNLTEWTELMQLLFPLGAPERATWADIDAICIVLNEVGKVRALNHMFFPNGGGNTITQVSRAGEEGFIVIEALGTSILKPLKLTFESPGVGSKWNYFRLEAAQADPTGISEIGDDRFEEYLTEIEPGTYESRDLWEYQGYGDDEELPETARPVGRYLRGSFVIFSTRSPYNLDSSTYDARHEKMSEDEFRDYIKRNSLRD